MDYLAIYVTIATVLAHQAVCRPDWLTYPHHDSHDYLHHTLPVLDHGSFFTEVSHGHLPELDSHSHGHYIKKYHGPIAIPVVLPSGHLADTPEVAVAKIHHLAAVAKAKADKYYAGHSEYGYGGAYGYSGSHHGYGIPVVLPSGHIADTKEVADAKSAHLLAVAKAKADKYYSGLGEGYGYGGAYGYSGSYHGYGFPVVLPNGHLADTKEVAAAKAAHMTAVAHAKAEQAKDIHHGEYFQYEHDYIPHHSDFFVSHEVSHVPLYNHDYSDYVQAVPVVTDHDIHYLTEAHHPVLYSHTSHY